MCCVKGNSSGRDRMCCVKGNSSDCDRMCCVKGNSSGCDRMAVGFSITSDIFMQCLYITFITTVRKVHSNKTSSDEVCQ